jgi:hypothetical protein
MRGAIPPFPHMSSWRGVLIKHGDNVTLRSSPYHVALLAAVISWLTRYQIRKYVLYAD